MARTLLDLAAVLDRHRLAQAVGTAEKRVLTDSPSLPVLIERHRGARGLTNLREILANTRLGLDVPASDLEVEFGAFLAERGLPAPERNVGMRIGGADYELDCLWRRRALVVELDSRAHHSDPLAFERDRARDAALLAAGLRTVRVTARRIRADRDLLERQLWPRSLRDQPGLDLVEEVAGEAGDAVELVERLKALVLPAITHHALRLGHGHAQGA